MAPVAWGWAGRLVETAGPHRRNPVTPRQRARDWSGDRPLLHLVFPRWQPLGLHRVWGHRMPPMALLVLAAVARRSGWRVRLVDRNVKGHATESGDERPDLAAITVWTPLAGDAYRIADAYRRRGVPVVLGGVHPSLLPTEALRHADAVVSGEAESVLPTVLADAAAGRLGRLYQGTWGSMDDTPTVHEWADLLRAWPISRYVPLNTLQTTRGCRFNCDFCSVIRINGQASRHRDPDVVVDELRVLKRVGQRVGDFTYVFFLDDDLAADRAYMGELCEAILRSGVRVTWGTQGSLVVARDEELLDLAARSGMRALFTGFESVSPGSLREAKKQRNRPGEYGELVTRLHRRGIGVEGGFIFGFDHDPPTVFTETAELADRIGVDAAHFSLLTPYPGTHTFARFLAEDRITSFDWSCYDLYHAVITPARMSREQLEQGLWTAYRVFYSGRRSVRRLARELPRRAPSLTLFAGLTLADYARHYRRSTPPPPARAHPTAPEDVARLAAVSAAPARETLTLAYRDATEP
ncbi:MAG TPA: radical SAM protein [Egibacteraceae bacterium]|nr:radical SAM protein [Egibacteraceae bacterium]